MKAGGHDGSNRHYYFQGVSCRMNTKVLDPLFGHGLIEMTQVRLDSLLERGIELQKEAIANGRFKPTHSLAAQSQLEQYCGDVFMTAMAVVRVLERANLAVEFVQSFPRPKFYRRRGITGLDWIEYHYALYAAMLTSALDASLILTNQVLGLGFVEKDCRWHKVTKHQLVKQTPIFTALKKYDDATQDLQLVRHLHLHRGKDVDLAQILGDDTIHGFKLLELAERLNEGNGTKVGLIDSDPYVSIAYGGVPERAAAEMAVKMKQLVPIVHELFDELTIRVELVLRLFDAATLQRKTRKQ